MYPTLTPPGFFDVTAPHYSGWAVFLLLVPPGLILIQVWGYRRFLRRLPAGPARHSIARLFVIGGGFWTAWIALFALVLIWEDAFHSWYNTLSPACLSSTQLTQVLGMQTFLQLGIFLGANLLGLVGVIILVFAFQRYQRARRAPRVIL
jgi:hypothetical protein